MKKLLTFLLTVMLAFGVGWAATTTVTASRVTGSSVTWTGSGNETWTVNVNGGATNQSVNNGYAQIGSSSSASTSVTFSTSGINGTITSIVVNCAAYQGRATVSATVAGNAFGTQGQNVPTWSNNSGGDVTFTGSASGAIVITMTNGNGGRAMYIKSITVTYETGSTPEPDPTIFHKVTSTNDLVAGQKYIIVYEDGNSSAALGALNSSNNVFDAVTGLAVSNNHQVDISGHSGVQVMTLEQVANSSRWLLNTASGYIKGSNSITFSYTQSNSDNTAQWTISDDGIVTNYSYSSRAIRYLNSTFRHLTYQGNDAVGSVAYLYVEGEAPELETCAAPTFSPAAGTYTEAQSVTISTTTSGASIYYTTDGSTPSSSNGTLYNGAINVSEDMTIKAIAVKPGSNDSPVSEAAYTIISSSGSNSKIYRKVTSTDDLIPGHKYIIVYENGNSSYAMGAVSGNYGSAIGVSVSNHQVNIANATGVVEFILGGNTNAWTLFMGDNYLGYSGSGTNLATNSTTPNNNYYWTIDNSAFIQNNGADTRYIRFYTSTPTFRAYTTSNGENAYLYVQNTEPMLHAEPNPLNIYDNNENGDRTGTITVTGENLGTDNVGVNVLAGSGNFSRWAGNEGWGFNNNGGSVNDTAYVTYNGHALSATGRVQAANNIVNTVVDVNYLYTGPIYVVGNVNDKGWQTVDGVLMTRDASTGQYTVDVNAYDNGDGNAYIFFTKSIAGNSYDALGDNRFGPVSGGNWGLIPETTDVFCPLDTMANLHTIEMAPGAYTITIDPATNKFKITPYVINVTITPEDGTHFIGSTISGTITDSPAGTIEWSTDGNNWQPYTDGFTVTVNQVDGSVTVYARSTSNGVTSGVVSATYTRDLAPAPEAPSFSMGSSAVTAGTVITITAPEGCTLYVNGQQVTNPYDVTINHGTTITAYCENDEGTPSTTVTYTYTIAAVCAAEVVFKDHGSDATATTTWNAIGGEDDNDYFEAGKAYIDEASDIVRVFKGTTGLKFGNSSNGGTITFSLDGDTEWKVSHITLNAKNYNGSSVTFTVTTDNGESQTTSEIGSVLGGYTLDFNGTAITSITISSTARAYLKGFTITYLCAPEIETATLAEIESTPSLDQKLVKVSDELIGAWAVVNPQTGAKLLWAKDQGNASIAKLPGKTDGQRDYVKDILKYKRILNEVVQPTWDESNWVVLDFSGINDADPFEFVGHKITENTVVGEYYEYSDGVNYMIKLMEKPDQFNEDPLAMDVNEYQGYDGPFPESKLGTKYDLAYNTYVPANFMTENHNQKVGDQVVGFVADDGALSGCQGDSLYFVNPKNQEVAHIWAVWNGGDEDIFTVYETEHKENENINAWHLNGTFRVNWSYNCTGVDPNESSAHVYGRPTDLVPNMAYEFHAVVMKPNSTRLTVAPQGTANPGTPSQSYVVYPLDMSNGGTPTAVIELNATKTVVGVSYYNLLGVESGKPFEGINIVVTRYSDGSISTQKVLR